MASTATAFRTASISASLQNALTPNFPHMLDEQVRHVAGIVQQANQRQAQVIEPTAEAEAEWVQSVRDTPNAGSVSTWNARRATTTAKASGPVSDCSIELYGAGPVVFFDLVRDWRTSGMKGLQFA